MKKIYIVVGSVRPHWLGRRIAQWVRVNARKQTDASVIIVDAEDIVLDAAEAAALGPRKYDLAEADGYILIAPEYESGREVTINKVVRALENQTALNKPVAFVSYGLEGGYKLVDRLRSTAKQLNLSPLRNAVHIEQPWEVIDQDGELHDAQQDRSLRLLIKQLTQWMAVANVS